MTAWADSLLLVALLLDLFILTSSRLAACVQTTALQGVALAILPLAIQRSDAPVETVHLVLLVGGTIALKAFLVPWLLLRALRDANIRREVEPFVSLHVSALLGAALVVVAFWLARFLPLPHPAPSSLVVPAAIAMLLLGFFVLVSRKKAVMQVVGYLMLENGVFVFGQTLADVVPFVVELSMLLDLLAGVFVFGITIHHISREFDHIDTAELSSLKD